MSKKEAVCNLKFDMSVLWSQVASTSSSNQKKNQLLENSYTYYKAFVHLSQATAQVTPAPPACQSSATGETIQWAAPQRA